jgi:uncharacterized protein YdeI (YjbR/CyaY-like superfamily)
MNGKANLPLIQPKSRKAWRAWLQKNHASSSGIWLVYAKKHTGIASVTYSEAVEEALCFGWIDSLVHSIDDSHFKQIFTPRKEKSAWSALNRTRVETLIANGLMTPAGMKLIDLAKKTGTWDARPHIEGAERERRRKEELADLHRQPTKGFPPHGGRRENTRDAREARRARA